MTTPAPDRPLPTTVTDAGMDCILCGMPATREILPDGIHMRMTCECCGPFTMSDAVHVMLESMSPRIRLALCSSSLACVRKGNSMSITVQNLPQLVAPYL